MRFATFALGTMFFVATLALAADPIDPAGRSYELTGMISGKALGTRSKGEGTGILRFGPDTGLADGAFSVLLNDGATVVDVRGTWEPNARGRLVCTIDTADLLDQLDDIYGLAYDSYFDSVLPGATWDQEVKKAKVKVRLKTKKGVEMATVRVKWKSYASAELEGTKKGIKATISFRSAGPRTK